MNTKAKLRRLAGGLLAICLLALSTTAAFAFEGRGDEEIVIIEADEVIADDLYVGANTLIINGTVEGDVLAAANAIEINGTVTGDIMAGGNSLVINGTVGDDVLFGGTALIIADGASIAGDLLAGGYGIEVSSGATVGGEVWFGALGARFDGLINGDVTGGGNGVEINGTIGGNVDIEVEGSSDAPAFDPAVFNPNVPVNTPRVDPGLRVGGNASIGGDLAYASTQMGEVPTSAVAGELTFNELVTHTEEQQTFTQRLLSWLWSAVQRWVVLVLIGWLLLRFMPNLIKGAAEQFSNNVGGGFLSGILLYFGWPIALAISLVVVILLASLLGSINFGGISAVLVGLGLAIIIVELILFILTLAFLCAILVSWLIGSRIMANNTRPILPLAIGAAIVVILTAIPYLGGLVSFVVGIAGLGSLWLWWRNGRGAGNALKTAAVS